jgi:hypothetical protein
MQRAAAVGGGRSSGPLPCSTSWPG